jgi:hypothetical protein
VTLSDEFEAAVNDPTRGIAFDLSTERDTLLVCFGGLEGGFLGPPFEFLRMTGTISTNRVFVRDLEQCWYQLGIEGLGTSVDETARSLSKLISDSGSRRTVFVGTSSGGFAALLFGSLLGVDAIVAVAPQTFVGAMRCRIHLDRRWPNRRNKARAVAVNRDYLDLRKVLTRHPPNQATIFVGTGERRDVAHARYVRAIANVSIIKRAGNHQVAKQMRDDGSLLEVIQTALNPG